MKFYLFIFLYIMSFGLYASYPTKIGIISDTHFLSPKLMDDKYAAQQYIYESGRNIIASPEILDQVIADYLQSDIDVLLVCGDMTKDGERQSHIDFRDKLKLLHNKGVKIFVIPGNHDINMPHPKGYRGNTNYRTENISPTEFATIYQEAGYKNALNRDEASLSYVAALDASTWLLAIDAARYEEYKNSSITAGRIKTTTKAWIDNVLQQAANEDKQVIAMMHWGVAEHLPMQGILFPNYLVDNYTEVANLLADNGVKLIFTGHFHSNDISEYTSNKGNKIYDIATGTLVSYPFSYRFVELYQDSITIRTKNITSTKNSPKLVENNKETMKRIASNMALPMFKRFNLDLPEHSKEHFTQIIGELFLLHLAGDEMVNDELKNELTDIFNKMGFPIDDSMNNLEIDLPPTDNNITLYFNK